MLHQAYTAYCLRTVHLLNSQSMGGWPKRFVGAMLGGTAKTFGPLLATGLSEVHGRILVTPGPEA